LDQLVPQAQLDHVDLADQSLRVYLLFLHYQGSPFLLEIPCFRVIQLDQEYQLLQDFQELHDLQIFPVVLDFQVLRHYQGFRSFQMLRLLLSYQLGQGIQLLRLLPEIQQGLVDRWVLRDSGVLEDQDFLDLQEHRCHLHPLVHLENRWDLEIH